MIAGIVTEGKRDFPIFEAVVKKLCPAVEDVLLVHPPTDGLSASRTSGWTGVRRWCRRYGSRLDRFMQDYGDSLDLLVIQVDASVASNQEIGLEQPCPPVSDTTNALRSLVGEWIGGQVPDGVVVVVPSKTSDAWVCAALVGGDESLECDPEPLERLADAGGLGFRLKRTSDGKVKKPTTRQFRIHLAPRVADGFGRVREICSEAERFALEVEAQCTQMRVG